MFSRILTLSFLLITFLLFSIDARAAAPANDNLSGRLALNGSSGMIGGTVLEATRETGEFTHSLSNAENVYKTVWYEWTANDSKPVVFEIASSQFDASIAIYTGDNFPLEQVSLNNDTIGNLPRAEFMAQSGTTYKIVVGIFNDQNAPGGSFALQWAQSSAPTNDNFAQALNLQNSAGAVAAANQSATVESGEPQFGADRSVWFNYTNPTAKDFSITFTTLRSRSAFFNSTLAVF
jgi:hypothetical protein